MDVYQKLKELRLTLPEAPTKGGVYTPCKLTEDGYAYIQNQIQKERLHFIYQCGVRHILFDDVLALVA